MYPWNKIPLLRAVIPFFSGILIVVTGYENRLFNLSHTAIILLILTAWFLTNKNLLRLGLTGALYFLLFFACGYNLSVLKNQFSLPWYFSKNLQKSSLVIARLTEPLTEKSKSYKSELKIIAVKNGKKIIHSSGNANIYLEKSKKSEILKAGDILVLKNKFGPVQKPLNPGEFNYKKYLENRQIYHQVFVKDYEWHLTGKRQITCIYAFLLELREKINDTFKTTFPDRNQGSLISSLIIGYRAEISPELMESFVNTGTIHVLSVSGLHVGVIYYIFQILLMPFRKLKEARLLKMFILLVLLWGYTMMTGLVPCVARAAIMLTFYTIGNHAARITNVYSSMLTAILIMLLVNPYVITQLGFQLSFAAVLGIIVVQPLISGVFRFRYKIPEKIWGLACVSIAAQVMTFPICIYYFNQFPVYFLFANLIVIPLSTLIIYTGIAFLILKLTGMTFITGIIAKFLGYTVLSLSKILLFFKDLPLAVKDNLYLNISSVILLFILLFLVTSFFLKKQKKTLIVLIITLLILIVNILFHKIKEFNKNSMTVYAMKGKDLTAFIEHQRVTLYGDSALLNNSAELKRILYNDFCKRRIKESNIRKCPYLKSVHSESNLTKEVVFHEKKILFINSGKFNFTDTFLRNYDYIVISGNPALNEDFFSVIKKTTCLVFNSGNRKKFRNQWVELCKNFKLNYFDMAEQGAFVAEF